MKKTERIIAFLFFCALYILKRAEIRKIFFLISILSEIHFSIQ